MHPVFYQPVVDDEIVNDIGVTLKRQPSPAGNFAAMASDRGGRST
jgi:hypothetical protein